MSEKTRAIRARTDRNGAKTYKLPARAAYDCLATTHGQRILAGALVCVDGTGSVLGVWRCGVLHSSRSSWPNGGGTGCIWNWGEGGRASAAGRKVADRS